MTDLDRQRWLDPYIDEVVAKRICTRIHCTICAAPSPDRKREKFGTLPVHLFLLQQALDTATSSGRAMYGMLGVFAEFERAMIVERVKAGLARARAQGKQLGRPKVPARTEAAIRQLRGEGLGIKSIAKRVGCGVGTVQRVVGAQLRPAS